MDGQRVARLADGDHKAGLIKIGEVEDGPQTSAMGVYEGLAAARRPIGAAVDGVI